MRVASHYRYLMAVAVCALMPAVANLMDNQAVDTAQASLLLRLRSRDLDVQMAGMRGLAQSVCDGTISDIAPFTRFICGALQAGEFEESQKDAILILQNIPSDQVRPFFEDLIAQTTNTDDTWIRQACISVLGRAGSFEDKVIVDALCLSLTTDSHSDVRRQAALALGHLFVQAALDTNVYETGIKVSDEELARIRLTPCDFHGEWNYTIVPRRLRN